MAAAWSAFSLISFGGISSLLFLVGIFSTNPFRVGEEHSRPRQGTRDIEYRDCDALEGDLPQTRRRRRGRKLSASAKTEADLVGSYFLPEDVVAAASPSH
jgi:hypothetical protein